MSSAKHLKLLGIFAATALVAAGPAEARRKKAPPPAPAAPVAPPVGTVVPSAVVPLTASTSAAAFFQARPFIKVWFKPGNDSAAGELVEILKRAQVDGLAAAPVLTAEVEAAIARARAGGEAEKNASERTLSAAWIHYVQTLRRPATGIEWGDPRLALKPPTGEWIMLQASNAPMLQQHLRSLAAVNPIYAQLRDIALAQLTAGQALDPRLQQNIERARILPASGRFIIVDAATARLWMFENGQIADSMKVVVGKRSSPTPMIASTISYTTFNPYWNVPHDVVKRVHARHLVKDAAKYLKRQGFEVASDWTDAATVVAPDEVDWKAVAAGEKEVRIRQLPGAKNMMGHYKFSFPNTQGIYLHDTPQKELFAKDRRTFSLGCVRVEDAERLARWLMGKDPIAPSDAPEQHVQLDKGVPIFLTYLTAHADAGQVVFSDDTYGLDVVPEAELAAAP